MKDLDKYRGCLIGGAVGDALGYPVEFMQSRDIFRKYGKDGITEYELTNGKALISDDTQMTLFTANGLLLGTTRGCMRGLMGSYDSYIALCYEDWYKTQYPEDFDLKSHRYSWLINVPELHEKRAPGGTCTQYLESQDKWGTVDNPKNNSKGCGGIMRVAPIGLYLGGKESPFTVEQSDHVAAEAAAITHGHELGYIPAAMLSHIVYLLAHTDASVLDAVLDAKESMREMFPKARHLSELEALVDKAIALASDDTLSDLDAIRSLGEGWVAEETLAIAVYCAIKYANDFEKAIVAAVNHDGDSDSTGAVTGNILGAHLGLHAIPKKFIENLELKDIILEIADDLFNDCQMSEYGGVTDRVWAAKYMEMTYPEQ